MVSQHVPCRRFVEPDKVRGGDARFHYVRQNQRKHVRVDRVDVLAVVQLVDDEVNEGFAAVGYEQGEQADEVFRAEHIELFFGGHLGNQRV